MTQSVRFTILPMLLACAPLVGCASAQPPQELLEARAAYQKATQSPAADLSPVSLHNAKEALDSAEKQFNEDGDSTATKDQAYIALRKAELAQTEGSIAEHRQELAQTHQETASAREQAAEQTQAELQRTREQLAKETDAREQAEQRAQDAMDKLRAANTAVKEEPRGTVITLPGNVLFASGKSMLLPGAQASLNEVANALKDQNNADIRVEGHTDSTGSDELNMKLSKDRADAVASYLMSRGLPKDRITTEGLGSSRPVANNATAEGRAINRRVEIIVKTREPR